MRSFCSGAMRAQMLHGAHALLQLGVGQMRRARRRSGVPGGPGWSPAWRAMAQRRGGVVAGDHHHADAGVVRHSATACWDLGAQRVGQAQQADELEVEVVLDGRPVLAVEARRAPPPARAAPWRPWPRPRSAMRACALRPDGTGPRSLPARPWPPPHGHRRSGPARHATWRAVRASGRRSASASSRGAGARCLAGSAGPGGGRPFPSGRRGRSRWPESRIPPGCESTRAIRSSWRSRCSDDRQWHKARRLHCRARL